MKLSNQISSISKNSQIFQKSQFFQLQINQPSNNKSEKMAQVYCHVSFNGGNQHFFKVRDDVTLKELKDLLHEINQRINHGDAMRVEYVWYHRSSFDSDGNLSFTRSKLTNDDDVRSMFSIFVEPNMVPLEMDVTLLRSPKDIFRSLIRPDEDV